MPSAFELRRKLEKFYATEAPDAPFRIEIPKGSYVPHFVRAPVLETLPPVAAPVAAQPVARHFEYLHVLLAFAAGVILTAAVFLIARSRPPRDAAWTRDLEEIWKPMTESKAPILVSFQTRLFLPVGPLNVRD